MATIYTGEHTHIHTHPKDDSNLFLWRGLWPWSVPPVGTQGYYNISSVLPFQGTEGPHLPLLSFCSQKEYSPQAIFHNENEKQRLNGSGKWDHLEFFRSAARVNPFQILCKSTLLSCNLPETHPPTLFNSWSCFHPAAKDLAPSEFQFQFHY